MKIIGIIFTVLILLLNQVNACAPFTSELIIVGEYNGLLENDIPDEREAKGEFQFIDIIKTEKLFSKYNLELGKYYFADTDRIDLSGFNKGDKIITISDYSNGDFSDYFTVHEIGKLSCDEENKLSIENRQGYFKAFGKEIWNCGSMKGKVPDYILSEDEILTKIENKYKLCKNKEIIKENIDENIEKSTINEIVENSGENLSDISPWYIEILQGIINFFKNIFS